MHILLCQKPKKAEKKYLCIVKAFYFNYSHDVQMSSGSILRNLSQNVSSLEYALQPLAVYAASPDDVVVVHPNMIDTCREFYQDDCFDGIRFASLSSSLEMPVEPWGWDVAVIRQLENSGIPGRFMCSKGQADVIRALSSRESACVCLREVRNRLPGLPLCGTSEFCNTREELYDKLFFPVVLKSPWSSSGRGVRVALEQLDDRLATWIDRVFQTQGALEIEPYYKRIADWAMEFYADEKGEVTYTGLSRFYTMPTFGYMGNIVALEDHLLREWCRYMPSAVFYEVRDCLTEVLPAMMKGKYTGPLGVDMMFCECDEGQVLLHPCVEINLRRTMGQIAQCIAVKMPWACPSKFEINYISTPEKARQLLAERDNGDCRLLTPLTEKTRFAACLRNACK